MIVTNSEYEKQALVPVSAVILHLPIKKVDRSGITEENKDNEMRDADDGF